MVIGDESFHNEKTLGEALREGIKKYNIKREDLWIIGKIPKSCINHDDCCKCANQIIQDMGLEYLDLCLLDWPVGTKGEGE